MILACYHLIARATRTFSTSILFTIVSRLVYTTEQVIFVLLNVLSIAIIASRKISLLRRWGCFNHNFFLNMHLRLSHLINNMACLHSGSSNSLHLLSRNRRSCYLFNCIHSNKFLPSDQIQIIRWY